MAHVELRVGDEHHITLVHFEQMDPEKWEAINQVMQTISAMIKKPPVGRFGQMEKVGRFKNVNARMIDSPWVDSLRARLHYMLDEKGILYSNNFDYRTHVSRPLLEWNQGAPVPFAPFLGFKWKEHNPVMVDYIMGK